MTTETLTPDHKGFLRAAQFLGSGACVAFPTETVYGLGADARDDRAVAGIFEAKGRPSFNPLIVHVPGQAEAEALADFSPEARRLAAAFWPGPLTIVVPRKPDSGLSDLVSAGLPSVALRVPQHPVAQGLLRTFGGPIAAPSANPSGRVSPTEAGHVLAGLRGRIAAVVDGGACPVGLESTIVDCTAAPVLLRAGGVSQEELEACLGAPLGQPQATTERPVAPGQLASHYAPEGTVRLNVLDPQKDEVFLGFGPVGGALNLSPDGDLIEAAANLFACLHKLDQMGAERIAVAPVPEEGLGRAINDRLRRAAAPRV
ncbi:L-threonylcarbamoyladenylate synthase [Flavimaricola marinus]|uniref:Threonylcarbamoyl-AMP synthase n=1 Tax=Flavimaricola marinus TaxID=1819565 RepID=A0A238LBQ0_9RHOB|nr:L-threonylcarbamoyladenylate synthase [Flavimaricola marinus]SMY06834.1 Threonylcarbamoyl-AMP synthase [Flavimaricola marinus]